MRINKLLSIVLSLCMVMMTLVPTCVWAETNTHTHCICGASHRTIGDHTAAQSVQWEAISSPEDLLAINRAGNYYLTANVTISSSWKPVDGVNLCLNGYSVIENRSNTVIEVSNNKTFTLTDCSGNGKITHERDTITGSGVSVTGGGTFYMYGGNIAGNSANDGDFTAGGGVYVILSTFYMNGGSITDNKAKTSSGGVYMYNASFIMNGGEISGNVAKNDASKSSSGGGVSAKGNFIMNGGKNSGNTATNGGGVFVRDGGTFTMTGGEISGSTASNGGGVYVNNTCTFEMTGGKISGNVAKDENSKNTSSGGGVYVTGEFHMLDGRITGNTAGDKSNSLYYGYGGGVYVGYNKDAYGSFYMQDGEISGNEASRSGGGVLEEGSRSTFTMTGGSIIGNKAYNYGGGGVYVGSNFTMSGGNIKGNSIVNYGGGVFVSEGAAMTVSGAVQITDNVKNGTWNTNTGMYEKGSDTYSNAYMEKDEFIIIGDDGLDGTARIGVITAGTPTDTNLVKFAEMAAGDVDYSGIFIPDVRDQNYCVTKKETTLYLRVHQHSWKYNLSTTNTNHDTITVTCSDDTCEDSGGRVTIEAPADLTYNGRAKAASVTKTNGLGDDVNITYQLQKDEENWETLTGDAKPTNAGNYTAGITLGEGNDAVTASVAYTINQADPICTAPSGLHAAYGQKLSDIEITNQAGNTAGTWSWVDGAQDVGSAGMHTFQATFTPDDKNNYNTMTDIDVSVTVSAKQIAPTVNVTGDMTYAGAQIKPTVTVTYDETTLIEGRDYTVSYGENINAGKGTVTITAKTGSNYSFDNLKKEFSITPKEVSVSGITAEHKVYNGGTNATISDNGTLRGKIGNDDLSYTVTGTFEDKNAGTDKTVNLVITLTGAESGNYKLAENAQKTTAADITAREITLTGGIRAESREYEAENRTVTLTKETLSFDNLVDGEMPDIHIPAKGTIETPDAGENKEVTYSGVTLADAANKGLAKNYKLSDQLPAVKVNITRAEGSVTAPTGREDLVYTGSPQALIHAGSSRTGTIRYKLGENGDYSTELPMATNAGEYTVFYKVEGDQNHKDIDEQFIQVRMAKATVTIAAKNRTAYVGDKVPDLSVPALSKDFTVSGLIGADTLITPPILQYVDEEGKAITPDMTKTGVYIVKAKGASTGKNYTPVYADGKLTVTNKPTGGGGTVAPAPTTPDTDVVTVKDDKTGATESGDPATTTTKTTVSETKTETTKNEQGETVSKTTASVSKETAEKLVDQAVSNKSDTVEITVKSIATPGGSANTATPGGGADTADGVKSTELAIPKTTVEEIAKNTDADLVIKTDSGEVTLDNKMLETIAKEAKGDTVTIVVNENTKLTEAQKPAEKIIGEKGKLFDLAASIGEKLLHHFDGGKAHVTLPMPEGLKGKDVLVIYINDKGFCEILSHAVEKVGADSYIKFTTSHFSTFAVVDKEEAEALIKAQNEAHVKELMKNAKFKVTTSTTGKKSVKVTVTAKNSKTLISGIKAMGYTVKYQFYRSTKKASGYKLLKTKTTSSFTNTTGKKGTKYYYKARVLVYDGKTLVAKSQLKQASYGTRTWTK